MSYYYYLPDVSVTNGSPIVQINDTASVFGAVPGSYVHVEGYTVPVPLLSVNTELKQITLAINWPFADAQNVVAAISATNSMTHMLAAVDVINQQAAQTLAIMQELPNYTQEVTDLNQALNTFNTTFNDALTESESARNEQIMRVSPAQDTSHNRRAFEHNHYDMLCKNVSPLPPENGPLKGGEFHFETSTKRLFAMFGNTPADTVDMTPYYGRRYFYIADEPIYISLAAAFTGTITLRIYPFSADGSGLPGNPTLTAEQWQVVSASVTNLDQIGTDGNGNYFYGIIDYIAFDDGRFVRLDETFYPDIPHLGGTITRNSGTLDNPFLAFRQRANGVWESDDITPDTANVIDSPWTQDAQNNRYYSGYGVSSDGTEEVELFSNAYVQGKTFEWAYTVHYLEGVAATTISNNPDYHVEVEKVIVFEASSERMGFKRAYGAIDAEFEVLHVKMLLPEVI